MSRTSRLPRATLPSTFATLGIAQSAHAQIAGASADEDAQNARAEPEEEIVVTGSCAQTLAGATEIKRQGPYMGRKQISSTSAKQLGKPRDEKREHYQCHRARKLSFVA
ncbi:hypothetical protein [Sphingomonas xinjiangensis]|uniref:Uncharacterized protein n=1 Tax=Sphingomonas xinjiangensis TaxID=643568 RepID=A0A840YI96_9SPHN|nr:hypothetical protein [Sphingomonas xinjiangensis]MBB5712145.1 hypothetical protein [Sphingomonas xinjiangensis]